LVLEKIVSDQWLWFPDPSGSYSVRGVYHLLTTKDIPLVHSTTQMIWHNQIPLKVSVFMWRLLHDRLSTKSNLANKGVVSLEVYLCVCGVVETAQHLFLSCSTFTSYGLLCEIGSVLWGWTPTFCTIIFYSLFTQQVVVKLWGFSFSLFGFFVFDFYGLSVIIGCLCNSYFQVLG